MEFSSLPWISYPSFETACFSSACSFIRTHLPRLLHSPLTGLTLGSHFLALIAFLLPRPPFTLIQTLLGLKAFSGTSEGMDHPFFPYGTSSTNFLSFPIDLLGLSSSSSSSQRFIPHVSLGPFILLSQFSALRSPSTTTSDVEIKSHLHTPTGPW